MGHAFSFLGKIQMYKYNPITYFGMKKIFLLLLVMLVMVTAINASSFPYSCSAANCHHASIYSDANISALSDSTALSLNRAIAQHELAIGDLNNDEIPEIAIINNKDIVVYTLNNGVLSVLATYNATLEGAHALAFGDVRQYKNNELIVLGNASVYTLDVVSNALTRTQQTLISNVADTKNILVCPSISPTNTSKYGAPCYFSTNHTSTQGFDLYAYLGSLNAVDRLDFNNDTTRAQVMDAATTLLVGYNPSYTYDDQTLYILSQTNLSAYNHYNNVLWTLSRNDPTGNTAFKLEGAALWGAGTTQERICIPAFRPETAASLGVTLYCYGELTGSESTKEVYGLTGNIDNTYQTVHNHVLMYREGIPYMCGTYYTYEDNTVTDVPAWRLGCWNPQTDASFSQVLDSAIFSGRSMSISSTFEYLFKADAFLKQHSLNSSLLYYDRIINQDGSYHQLNITAYSGVSEDQLNSSTYFSVAADIVGNYELDIINGAQGVTIYPLGEVFITPPTLAFRTDVLYGGLWGFSSSFCEDTPLTFLSRECVAGGKTRCSYVNEVTDELEQLCYTLNGDVSGAICGSSSFSSPQVSLEANITGTSNAVPFNLNMFVSSPTRNSSFIPLNLTLSSLSDCQGILIEQPSPYNGSTPPTNGSVITPQTIPESVSLLGENSENAIDSVVAEDWQVIIVIGLGLVMAFWGVSVTGSALGAALGAMGAMLIGVVLGMVNGVFVFIVAVLLILFILLEKNLLGRGGN